MPDREEAWRRLGDFIKTQRQLHELSLRQLAEAAKVSNPYLSQLERGMYKPSVEVLRNLASALRVSTETMLTQAGLLGENANGGGGQARDVETAVRLDPALTTEQKEALLGVYRGFLGRPAPATARRRTAPAKARKPVARGGI